MPMGLWWQDLGRGEGSSQSKGMWELLGHGTIWKSSGQDKGATHGCSQGRVLPGMGAHSQPHHGTCFQEFLQDL